MKGKALVTQLTQKKYEAIVWIKDENAPKGKRLLESEPQNTWDDADAKLDHAASYYGENSLLFTGIQEVFVELEGEFYIRKGYHS